MALNRRRCVPVLEECEPRFLPSAIPVHGREAVASPEIRIMPVTAELFRVQLRPEGRAGPRPRWRRCSRGRSGVKTMTPSRQKWPRIPVGWCAVAVRLRWKTWRRVKRH